MPFNTPKGRQEAERIVESSLHLLRERGATRTQLSDLADAVDALSGGSFNLAVELALAALRTHAPDMRKTRPASIERTLPDLVEQLRALKKSRPN